MGALRFSPKQRQVLTWWREGSPHWEKSAIICDGAVRSGKTLCLGLSFFLWAMARFQGRRFALCGRSMEGVRRNLTGEVLPLLRGMGFQCREQLTRGEVTVSLGRRRNIFCLFGGGDEGAAARIQGVTLAGALLDEAVLMPRSFVEQCCARCSVQGARLWFSCNPEGPGHWFYQEWVQKAGERNALYLHFTMEDNPGLSPQVRERYRTMFQGTFYRRFVLGEWTAAAGLVYDFFSREMVCEPPEGRAAEWYISCDYGTVNPTSMGLWGRWGEVWYRVEEFYYDSRREGRQKTDSEYADALEALADGRPIREVVADPSAASFLECLRRRGWQVRRAENEVLSGIRTTAELLRTGRLVICPGCGDAIREFGLYRWDTSAGGRDQVCKEHDHAMDDIRYFAVTVAAKERGGSWTGSVERRIF